MHQPSSTFAGHHSAAGGVGMMTKRRLQRERQTPRQDQINGRHTPTGGEGQSRLGRYIHTRHEDGTFDVEFVSSGRRQVIGERISAGKAYSASVAHNKKLAGITGGGS
jgi:hypothetical protein